MPKTYQSAARKTLLARESRHKSMFGQAKSSNLVELHAAGAVMIGVSEMGTAAGLGFFEAMRCMVSEDDVASQWPPRLLIHHFASWLLVAR